MHKPATIFFVVCLALAWYACFRATSRVRADEGMWPLNAFPSAEVQKKYGFAPDQAWLDHVRLASARLAQGCSGSFVSRDGLVMTNHHCAHECLEQLSGPKRDLIANGFYAKTQAEELRCPALEVNQLIAIEDVSQQIAAALANKTGQAYSETKKAESAKLEKACATSDDLRCEVVELYEGARHHLYKYQRFQDVRVVFAPELASAFFGGDPDNFNFPRYDLDVSFLRIYSGGKPAKMEHYFPFSAQGAQADQLTFTSGHPGHTSRDLTVTELLFERRVLLPRRLLSISELRGQLIEFGRRGAEQARYSKGLLFGVENTLKALKGQFEALMDGELLAKKRKQEQALKARLAKDARPGFATAYSAIDKAVAAWEGIVDYFGMLEVGRAFPNDLFNIARTLVRAADELPKPNEQRLPEYSDAALPGLKQELFSPAPIHPDLEQLRLRFGLTKLREVLGADDPIVFKVLGKKSPEKLAAELVRGTTLANVATRKQLFEGGKAAIEASRDPMIAFARLVDGDARSVRKRYEDEIESALDKAHEAIAAVRFETYGTSLYPDATFTLRLSYGTVRGWQERGKQIAPFTNIRGAFERDTGEEPFALPKSWLNAKAKLNLDTPFNFASTNDIVGGNSGSPVIDRNAQIVGLIFDGNIWSLGGQYGFDERLNRAVAVHSASILEALRSIYGAGRIADELQTKP
jgi:hypothetical protein